MAHDYKRNGTTTLFAALNILDGTVIGRHSKRHRHQEFIAFLDQTDNAVPAGPINFLLLTRRRYGSVLLHLRREDRPSDPESKDSEERLPIRPPESGVSSADSQAVGFG